MKVKYTAHATASGTGRTGHSETDDGKVSVNLSSPKEMGGDGGPGTNPEQLFAVGYSACFLGAMRAAEGRQHRKLADGATVTAEITLLDREDGIGSSIGAALTASVPGMTPEQVAELMQRADQICPYSHALRHAVDVKLAGA